MSPHYRRRGVPRAAHGLAVQFTLLAASGMIGNQRLEHSSEPRGKSFGSDTLGGNAGALAQQEHFVGETLAVRARYHSYSELAVDLRWTWSYEGFRLSAPGR
jgi:hypothetical protein